MLKNFIQSYVSRWANDLCMERTIGLATKNSMAFSGLASFGEVLCSLLTGMHGKGGGGSGHDLSNGTFAGEVKTVCWCQPWKCMACSKKNNIKKSPWVSATCIHCGSSNLNRVDDSRASISANTHLKHIDVLKEYYIVLVNHDDGDKYYVKVWKIDSCNTYFDNYVRNQATNGSKDTCNLIPESYDFHMSGPKLIYEIKLCLGSDPKFETFEHDKIEDVPLSVLKPEEKVHFPDCTIIPYDEACEKLVLRKKNLKKPRGYTTRSV
jgi:hypothetical protein